MRPGYDFHRAPEFPDGFGFWGHGPFHVFDIPWWTAGLSFFVGLALYLVPTLIAYRRKHHNRAAIALLNILLGWTFFGWALALVWAATSVRTEADGRRRPVLPDPPPAVESSRATEAQAYEEERPGS